MLAAGESASALLTFTNLHGMAIGLKIKQVDEAPVYVMLFYDPTFTASHRRIRVDSLDAVHRAVNDAPAPLSRPGLAEALLIFSLRRQDMERLHDGQALTERAPGTVSSGLPPFSPDAFQHLIDLDCLDVVAGFMPAFCAMDISRRLATLAPPGEFSPMYRVMACARIQALPIFEHLVAGLPDAACAEALIGRNANGTPALGGALLRGHTEMFRPYWQLVQACLPEAWHYYVMRASCEDNAQVLYFVMWKGHVGTFDAFIDAFADMPSNLLANLLLAPAADNNYGIVAAVADGHEGIVRTFHRALGNLDKFDASRLVETVLAQLRIEPRVVDRNSPSMQRMKRIAARYGLGAMISEPPPPPIRLPLGSIRR